MPCPDCESDLRTAGPYCAACGARLSWHGPRPGQAGPLNRGTAPVLELRPRYHRALVWRAQLPIAIFLTAWGTLAAGGASAVLCEALGLPVAPGVVLATFAVVLAAVLPAGGLVLGRRACRRARLRLHPDKLLVRDGLFACHERTLAPDDLVRVEVRRSHAQAARGLGSLLLHTREAVPVVGHLVRIDDVAEADEARAVVERMLTPVPALEAPQPVERAA